MPDPILVLLLQPTQPLHGKDVQSPLSIDLTVLIGTEQHEVVGLVPQTGIQRIPTPRRPCTDTLPDDVRQLAQVQRPRRHRALKQIRIAQHTPAPAPHPRLQACLR